MKIYFATLLVIAIAGCARTSERAVNSEPNVTAAVDSQQLQMNSNETAVHESATPGIIAGVTNFAQISPILFRGEQPTAQGFAELKKRGVRTIISLRTWNDDSDLLKGTGLQYLRIAAKPWHPEEEDLLEFLKALHDPANQPVFVHCMQGSDRTGYMVASYRMIDQRWTYDEAVAEMNRFHFHELWTLVPRALKKLDPESIREKLAREPKPKIRMIE